MALIRNIDFRKGNSVEQITSTLPFAHCLINRTRYGYAMDSISNVRSLYFPTGGIIPFGEGDWSAEFFALCDNGPSSTKWFFGQGGSGVTGVQIYNSGGVAPSAVLRDSAGTIVNPIVTSGYQRSRFIHYVLVCDRTNQVAYFIVNGVKQGEVSTATLVGSLTNSGIVTGLMAYGTVTNDTMTGQMAYFRLYDHIITVSEAENLRDKAFNFKPIAEQKRGFIATNPLVVQDSFIDSPADNIANTPRDWERKTGTWTVKEFTDNQTVLTDIVKTDKYLECSSAGVMGFPDNNARGTWEFDFYKGADANVIRHFIISDRIGTVNETQGYYFTVTANEQVGLIKNNVGSNTQLLLTANSYVANNTWYRARITRDNSGVFTLLLKGGSLTPTSGYNGWHLVSATGGTGTNPVTDNTYSINNYIVNVGSTGDLFTNFKHFKV